MTVLFGKCPAVRRARGHEHGLTNNDGGGAGMTRYARPGEPIPSDSYCEAFAHAVFADASAADPGISGCAVSTAALRGFVRDRMDPGGTGAVTLERFFRVFQETVRPAGAAPAA